MALQVKHNHNVFVLSVSFFTFLHEVKSKYGRRQTNMDMDTLDCIILKVH